MLECLPLPLNALTRLPLDTYVQAMLRQGAAGAHPLGRWRCPICAQPAPLPSLRQDAEFQALLNNPTNYGVDFVYVSVGSHRQVRAPAAPAHVPLGAHVVDLSDDANVFVPRPKLDEADIISILSAVDKNFSLEQLHLVQALLASSSAVPAPAPLAAAGRECVGGGVPA